MTVARGLKPELRWGLPTGQELVLLLSWVFIGLSGADVLTNFFVDIVIDQTDISVTPAGVRLLSLGFLGPLTSEPSPSFGHWRRGDFASGCGHGAVSLPEWGRCQNRACPRPSWGAPLVGLWPEWPG